MVINKRPDVEPDTSPAEVAAVHSPPEVEPELDGATFRAVRRLSNTDDETLANAGETCERVPPASLRALLAGGHIAPKGGA